MAFLLWRLYCGGVLVRLPPPEDAGAEAGADMRGEESILEPSEGAGIWEESMARPDEAGGDGLDGSIRGEPGPASRRGERSGGGPACPGLRITCTGD